MAPGVDGLSDRPVMRRLPATLPNGDSADLPAPPKAADWNGEDLGDILGIGAHTDSIRREFSK